MVSATETSRERGGTLPSRQARPPGGPDRSRGERRRGRVRSPEPLARLSWFDWLFVFFAWLTLFWAVFITLDTLDPEITPETLAPERPEPAHGFDFMPVLVGIPVVFFAWRAVGIGDAVADAVERLEDGAGLDIKGEYSVRDFYAALSRTVRNWSLGSGAVIGVGMSVGFGALLAAGLLDFGTAPLEIALTIALGGLMIGVGAVLGYLLGRLAGYGHFFGVMERHGIEFAVTTRDSRSALGRLDGVFRYAVVVTVVLCHWFAAWFVAWALGYDTRDYRATYQVVFLILFFLSFGFYLSGAWRPARAFAQRLDTLAGGALGRAALERQLAEAAEDRRLLDVPRPNRSQFNEAKELDGFIVEKRAQRLRSPLSNRWLLDGLALWIGLLLAFAVASTMLRFGQADPGADPPARAAFLVPTP